MTAQVTRTYDIRTYGCQMNVHDSERLAGLLESSGYVRAAAGAGNDVDLVVFNTCAVRENADNKLYGNLGHILPAKKRRAGMQVAVGGCLAQKDRGTIQERAPWVDVVFGTHNLASLPVLLERARHNHEAQVEIVEALQNFPSDLPSRRESPFSAWVSISVGCDNTCTFCIVPSLRGREVDRRPGDVLAEIEALVAEGVVEVTLLGQNVNSYGRSFGDPGAFAALLRACGRIEGLERVRFTSPHPRDFTDDVIAAMAETEAVCPQLHMPMQSGSDAVLRAMRRSYRRERYLGIIDAVRARMPAAAITTDIIIGFPGETEADFVQTLDAVTRAAVRRRVHLPVLAPPGYPGGHAGRPGAEGGRAGALRTSDRGPGGHQLELQPGPGRTRGRGADQLHRRPQGRCHRPGVRACPRRPPGPRCCAARPVGRSSSDGPRPGDTITTTITEAAPHHLVADAPIRTHRRWRGELGRGRPHASRPVALTLTAPGLSLGRHSRPRIGPTRDRIAAASEPPGASGG